MNTIMITTSYAETLLSLTPQLKSQREHLVRAGENLWRVLDSQDHVRGHLRTVANPLGVRYRAERLHLPSGTFRLIGEFWRADDAVSALRYS